ncbi:MAG TPA: transglutaminase domain-containing protein [Paracoccus sp. (in: a-proteobacteria)]|uniref:transglutaminase-like domain-containing protein n=1 Tax=Paracoccus sp. TaxID=267 RepID=UPI002C1465AA|nr:transglutaminase domain-containing protein [Paracoccus sp. (in: a-proteobacteria)]HWL55709.1 transglutaminase domain-containing protein [Paracoccus sp. (in: a-proteobacteria)]
MTSHSRRNLLKLALFAGTAPLLGGIARQAFAADRPYAPAASDWRRFETRTLIELPQGEGQAQVWLPVPSLSTDYQRSLDDSWSGNATAAEIVTDPASGAKYLHATFEGGGAPRIELVSRIETRNRTIDWNRTSDATEDPAVLKAALQPSGYKPLDGIVAETAGKITAGAQTDVDKVRAIYAWIVSNCYRNMDTPGCGPGDNVATLTTAGLGGKCADLNGLFVGLARASGVPARDVFGVRVAPSAFGYKQLGANSEKITGAQHCRAEVWLSGYGWVAMDPADVLKVMRAETETWIKDPKDPLVNQVNAALFGNWEGNWVAYNTAEDLQLSGRAGKLPFLMYPQASIGERVIDELDAKSFTYEITAAEV